MVDACNLADPLKRKYEVSDPKQDRKEEKDGYKTGVKGKE
jgi:hypothetical protein